ncbi:MAG: hypothetical protein K2X43_01285 [Hyphomonadaceae bacterium]|nr:hypothetical protein [Hyphomonadaceae bacterium]
MTVSQSTNLFAAGFNLTRSQNPTAVNVGAFDDAVFDINAFQIEEDTQDGLALQGSNVMTSPGLDLTRPETAFS